MKKVITGISLMSLLLSQVSCSSEDDQTLIESLPSNYQVVLPKNVPSDLLSKSSEDLFSSVSNRKLSLEELNEIVEHISQDIPNFENMLEGDIKQIQEIFVGISEIDIKENKDLIDSVFTKIQQYRIAEATNANKIISARTSNYQGGLCSKEFWLLFSNPRFIWGTQKASIEAQSITIEKFGSNDYYGKGDAFRHSLWNALIAKYCGSTVNSIQKAVNWAEKFTYTHEECGTIESLESKMDLHNNHFGRHYFSKVSWVEEKRIWFWKVKRVHAPETMALVDYFYQEAFNNSVKVASEIEMNTATTLVRLK
ncbi:MAG: DUF6973 domain-containing protein [Flavobacteriales bacterium]